MKLKGTHASAVATVVILVTLVTTCGPTDVSSTSTPIPPTATPVPDKPMPTATPLPPMLTLTPPADASMGPAARVYHSMVYDANNAQLLLFGGTSYFHWGMDLRDVWAFNAPANEWKEVGVLEAAVNGIEAHAAAYDEESDRVIILNKMGDTWAYQFDTSEWEQMKPMESPSGRCGHTTAYDAESDRVVLFGGFKCTSTSNPFYNDTWVYDFNADAWTEMRPLLSPAARIYHGMVYDSESDRAIIWGGRPHQEAEDTAVWAYDYNSNTWTVSEATTGPPLRFAYPAMAYHPESDRVIVFGGVVLDSTGSSGTLIDQTWAYDLNTNTWMLLEPVTSPTARAKHAMAYDGLTGRIILFGGVTGGLFSAEGINGETWSYDPTDNEWIKMTATSTSP